MSTADADAPVEVDARGLSCPLPVVELAQAVGEHPVGTRFRLVSTDVGSRVDIPVWCRMKRQTLLRAEEQDGEFVFVVEKAGDI